MKSKWEPLIAGTPFSRAPDPDMKDRLEKRVMDETQVFRNNLYTVHRRERQMFNQDGSKAGILIHLSIHDHARSTRRDWRHFQRIKNELIGTEEEAVEIYPAESRLVDISNEWHLWCWKGFRFPFGFDERWVSEGGYDVGGRQRKWDESDRPSDLRDVTKQDIEDYCKGGT